MKKKSKLSQLEVDSFVTSVEMSNEQTVKGGAGLPKPIDTDPVITVVTFGYWSWCCPGGTGSPL